jgi:hypothetical protein
MTTTITVTRDHIRRGVQAQCSDCPVALAACEATGAAQAEVPIDELHLLSAPWDQGGRITHRATLPARVTEWVRRFDLEGPGAVRPITFQVTLYPASRTEKEPPKLCS